MNDNELDKTDDMAALFEMMADLYSDDDPLESVKCKRIAKEIRDAENES